MLADDIARELSEPGQSCNEKLQELFAGTDVFDEKGKMNRPKAAAIIFKDEARRNGMNEILHPAVKEYVLHVLEQEKEEGRLRYLVLEAALLSKNIMMKFAMNYGIFILQRRIAEQG